MHSLFLSTTLAAIFKPFSAGTELFFIVFSNNIILFGNMIRPLGSFWARNRLESRSIAFVYFPFCNTCVYLDSTTDLEVCIAFCLFSEKFVVDSLFLSLGCGALLFSWGYWRRGFQHVLIGLYRGFKICFLGSFDDFAGALCGILLLFLAWVWSLVPRLIDVEDLRRAILDKVLYSIRVRF